MAHLSILMCHVGCYGDVPQNNMGNKDSCDVDIELESDHGALNIHEMHVLSHICTHVKFS